MTSIVEDEFCNLLPEGFNQKKVSAAITALLNHAKVKTENGLFTDSTTRFLLDITTFKIPTAEHHFFNIVLPNSPYPVDADILLVVPDDFKNSTDKEVVVARVKDGLETAGIKLREVMTLRQMRDEYSTFEAKRQLANRIDHILVDNRVFKNLSTILGREFYKKKIFPISLNLDPELRTFNPDDFTFALKKSVINICTTGTRTSMVIGHSNLSQDQLTENVSKICNWLLRQFPGGWENIYKLAVAIPGVPPLIIYVSEGSPNDVKAALGKQKKLPPPEEDELSTMPGRKVRVHPTGKIDIIRQDLDEEEKEIIRALGVELDIKGRRSTKQVKKEPLENSEPKKKQKMDLEEKYVDETSKRLDFEEEAAAADDVEDEVKKKPKSKKNKSKGKKKVKS